MKSGKACPRLRFIASFFALVISMIAHSQGKVVINEYMPWPSNACGTTSEFVELLNYGPGPMNIGCYTLTNGKYSITIPANTVLQAGEFYLLAGQNTLPLNCGNIDSAVTVDLNWSTCGCTNAPIPTTGDGFMKDGGGANVNLVLFDIKRTIIDAVTRKLPTDPAIPVTTSSVGGNCVVAKFDLDTMSINYETLGMATGVENSFARKLDGDCGWEKQPKISADASNNTHSTSTADVTYQFSIIRSMDLCDGFGGSISIAVSGTNMPSYFPMNYILAFDDDNNGVFDLTDTYTYGADSTPNSVDLTDLTAGNYIITVSSVKGCNLKTFPFYILPCTQVLDAQLLYFKSLPAITGFRSFEWQISQAESLHKWMLESSANGVRYQTDMEELYSSDISGEAIFRRMLAVGNGAMYYRLCLVDKNGKKRYSPVILAKDKALPVTIGKNPVSSFVHLKIEAPFEEKMDYAVRNSTGILLKKGGILVTKGVNDISIPVTELSSGIYLITLASKTTREPVSFRFSKQ
ncbi:MAG: type sorting protein [Flaviaesturariibacter sp.]|nr:type sorting protein [Flaviaesturariibacter sp.]